MAEIPPFDPGILKDARVRSGASERPVLDILAELTSLDVTTACGRLAAQFDMDHWDHHTLSEALPMLDVWPLSKAQKHRCMLVRTNAGEGAVLAVITDPLDGDTLVKLEQAAGQALNQVLCTPEDLHACLARHEATLRAIDSLVAPEGHAEVGASDVEVLSLNSATEDAPAAVRLLNSTLYDALKAGASDVHLESTAAGMKVRYRLDGVLDDVTEIFDRSVAEQAISRLKVLAQLDIAERRVPQDGSFQVQSLGRVVDLRVSIMPSIHGEDAVVRILDKQSMVQSQGRLTLHALGFDEASLTALRRLAEAAYGMLLVTGPTGSGKTTTLYAALAETDTGRDKVITIEDPVEYQLAGVLQIPVNEKKGLTFARGLRSILRHDPDKIMVGEIRDRETAEIAVQSALTGHLVLTTVHANNVFDVFGRFTHMGLDPYTLVSALNGIWAQRLVRQVCNRCAQTYVPTETELQRAGLPLDLWLGHPLKRGTGCGDCRGTGYKGRRAIAEILVLDDELREMIVRREPSSQIKQLAKSKGTRPLIESALELVRSGITTLEEVRRVTLSN